MKRYAAIEAVIADLEQRRRGAQVKWVDRTVFFPLVGRMEPLNPEDCPLLEFDMDQLENLTQAAQMGLGVLLDWIGFPALEQKGDTWENRRGVVRLEDAEA